jgi:hypothetical protein
MLSHHIGVRGDIRYFRTLKDDEPDDNPVICSASSPSS